MAEDSPTPRNLARLAGSGDDGTTGLLGGGRAPKNDVRIEAYGTVDEASSALGLAKALTTHPEVRQVCEDLQRDLYRLGAELAMGEESRFELSPTSSDDVDRLSSLCAELEASVEMPRGFVLPGTTPASGALDLARTIVRRAERRCLDLGEPAAQVRRYLNRLSLVVFVLGRLDEQLSGQPATSARSDHSARH